MKKPLASVFLAIIAIFLMASCGLSFKVVDTMELTLEATDNVNPDINGRPSPLVVKVYELQEVSNFKNADFFQLFDDVDSILGSDLLDKKEYELSVGQSIVIEKELVEGVSYIAVFASYRDVNKAKWKDSIKLLDRHSHRLNIRFLKTGIRIFEQKKQQQNNNDF